MWGHFILSKRRFYQKITDIYATAFDYDRTAKTTKQFFAKVQNKMHYAVHELTAAELIYERADADKPHMGLTTWAAAPEGKIVKSDVSVAKNYLSENEMRSLERIVSAYLDLAEDRAERHGESPAPTPERPRPDSPADRRRKSWWPSWPVGCPHTPGSP